MPHLSSPPNAAAPRFSALVAEADPAVAALLAEALGPRSVLATARTLAEAKAAFDALTTVQKALVDDAHQTKLSADVTKMTELKAAAAESG